MENFLIKKYEKSEKIEFKNFEINHTKNKLILKKLAEIILSLNKLNQEVIITGSIGFFLKYNKVYRSFKDIDLLISDDKFQKIKYLEFFNQQHLIALNKDFSTVEKYLKHFLLDGNKYILSLYTLDKTIQIDLIPRVKENNIFLEKVTYNNIKYQYTLPLKYIDKKFSYNRSIDFDDIEFFNKYLTSN